MLPGGSWAVVVDGRTVASDASSPHSLISLSCDFCRLASSLPLKIAFTGEMLEQIKSVFPALTGFHIILETHWGNQYGLERADCASRKTIGDALGGSRTCPELEHGMFTIEYSPT